MSATLVSCWKAAQVRLTAVGIDSPALDARLLVERALNVARADLLTDPKRPVSEAQLADLEVLVRRREAREPLAYILGQKEFWSMTLQVTAAVLTPRPDTETVVHVALLGLPEDRPVRVLDLGVGSGAILLAVLKDRPLATGLGIDASHEALAIAAANIEVNGLADRATVAHGHWADGVEGAFDLIISNPPYIASEEIDTLEAEVRDWEPRLALDGGEDGLDAYRHILGDITRLLVPGARCVFEIGYQQAAAVSALMGRAGFSNIGTNKDLTGNDRAVSGIWRGVVG